MDAEQFRIVDEIVNALTRKSFRKVRDDLRQELWVKALREHQLFDPTEGVPYHLYMWGRLPLRLVDVLRTTAEVNRAGKPNFTRTVLSELLHEDIEGDFASQVPDPNSSADTTAVDFRELERHVFEFESIEVRCVFLVCCGERRPDIAQRLGLTRQQVDWILRKKINPAAARLHELFGSS